MTPIRGSFQGLRESGAYALRDGIERLSKASAAIVRPGSEESDTDDGLASDERPAEPAVTISISDQARLRPRPPVRSEDLLGNLLELHRSGITFASGVAILKTAEEMESGALSIGRHRSDS